MYFTDHCSLCKRFQNANSTPSNVHFILHGLHNYAYLTPERTRIKIVKSLILPYFLMSLLAVLTKFVLISLMLYSMHVLDMFAIFVVVIMCLHTLVLFWDAPLSII